MAKKDDDAKRRKQLRDRKAEARQRERSVKFQKNGQTMVLSHGGHGYDVEMIRDFFDHLMLELKNRHDESVVMADSLEAGDPWKYAYAKSQQIKSPVDDELYRKYLSKYRCALLMTNSINTQGATDEEITMFLKAQRTAMIQSTEAMMDCLTAFEPLMDEALMCAKMPFGPMANGEMAAPTNQISVMDHIEQVRKAIEADLLNEEETSDE